ncbi:hypothetical protein NQ028_08515 [Corynebacterium phoceense]|uniref:hypothetical protein n=1 Tax=Corynebacterium phoceense TaxID=1686286 RepID=UPI00211C71E1|nr:hypothetical protein [Corynebacterium phoceense]MCQ9341178.1 hypothetical protein [Corynebacterium phoceense]
MSVMDNLKKLSQSETVKAAGASVAEVAKTFGENVKADRAAHPQEATPADASLKDKATAAAKEWGGVLRRSVEATAGSESVAKAKDSLSEAATEVRTTFGTKGVQQPKPSADDSVVEGEVISSDDPGQSPYA